MVLVGVFVADVVAADVSVLSTVVAVTVDAAVVAVGVLVDVDERVVEAGEGGLGGIVAAVFA